MRSGHTEFPREVVLVRELLRLVEYLVLHLTDPLAVVLELDSALKYLTVLSRKRIGHDVQLPSSVMHVELELLQF